MGWNKDEGSWQSLQTTTVKAEENHQSFKTPAPMEPGKAGT